MKRKITLVKPDAWDKIPGTEQPPKWLVYLFAYLIWVVAPIAAIWFLIWLIFF